MHAYALEASFILVSFSNKKEYILSGNPKFIALAYIN